MNRNSLRAANSLLCFAALALIVSAVNTAGAQKRTKHRSTSVKQTSGPAEPAQPAWSAPNGASALADAVGSAL
ncbi:MAG TPA: hypothetical protein VGM50_18460, partial [Gemmatimonadaceae bacterium]